MADARMKAKPNMDHICLTWKCDRNELISPLEWPQFEKWKYNDKFILLSTNYHLFSHSGTIILIMQSGQVVAWLTL